MKHIESYKQNSTKKEETPIVLPEKDAIETLPLTKLRGLKKNIENVEEYENYLGQKVNFETLDGLQSETDKLHFDKDKLGGADEAKKILSLHIENVKTAANNYYQKIERMSQLIELQKERLDKNSFENWLEKQDAHRSQIHNILIDSLKILTRFCVNQNENLKVKTLFSLTGAAFPQDKLFSAIELNDRDFVGDWAFHVEKGRKLKEIHDFIEQKINESSKKPAV